MDPLTIGMIASTALSAGGSILGGKAQKKAAQEQAAQKRRASLEIETRKNINKQTISSASQLERADLVGGIASAGFDINSTSSMAYLNQSLNREFQEYSNLERETAYEQATLKAEEASLLRGGRSAQSASYLEAGSSILGGMNSFMKAGGVEGMKNRTIDAYGIGSIA